MVFKCYMRKGCLIAPHNFVWEPCTFCQVPFTELNLSGQDRLHWEHGLVLEYSISSADTSWCDRRYLLRCGFPDQFVEVVSVVIEGVFPAPALLFQGSDVRGHPERFLLMFWTVPSASNLSLMRAMVQHVGSGFANSLLNRLCTSMAFSVFQ